MTWRASSGLTRTRPPLRRRTSARRSSSSARASYSKTVLSDPVGEEIEFLRAARSAGYTVVLCFIGLDSAEQSDDRVAMRVMQGGHDVPADKIVARYPRTLENLRRAIRELPHVLVFDNGDLGRPFRKVAELEHGRPIELDDPLPHWLPRS
jgi:predicted ABC-type ATPase